MGGNINRGKLIAINLLRNVSFCDLLEESERREIFKSVSTIMFATQFLLVMKFLGLVTNKSLLEKPVSLSSSVSLYRVLAISISSAICNKSSTKNQHLKIIFS